MTNAALWIVAALTATAFFGSGAMKVFQPTEKLRTRMAYVEDFSSTTIKGIGALEVLGAVGLIVPWAVGVLRVLTPLAASGLAALMLGAIAVHVRRKESKDLVMPIVLLALSTLEAVGRFTEL